MFFKPSPLTKLQKPKFRNIYRIRCISLNQLFLLFLLISSILNQNSEGVKLLDVNNFKHDKVVFHSTNLTLQFDVSIERFMPYSGSIMYSLLGTGLKVTEKLYEFEKSNDSVTKKENLIIIVPKNIEVPLPSQKLKQNFEIDIFINDNNSNNNIRYKFTITSIPGWTSLFPIVILILSAVLLRHALIALSIGLYCCCLFIYNFNPIYAFMHCFDYYIKNGIMQSSNIKIMLCLLLLCGLIGGLQKGGGAKALTNKIANIARTRTSVQMSMFLTSLVIFVDDFASILIVGPNLLDLSDILLVSREKLAFIVHVMASPLSCICPISSWIGTELGLINIKMDNKNNQTKPFALFLRAIPRCYFIICIMVFCLGTIVLQKEFGPMKRAEIRAYREKKVVNNNDVINEEEEQQNKVLEPLINNKNSDKNNQDTETKWYNAAIPIVIVIVVTIGALFWTGYEALEGEKQTEQQKKHYTIEDLAGAGDPAASMMYATFLACIVSFILHKTQGIMKVASSIDVFIEGAKDLLEPLFILFMAWGIGEAFSDLKSASYIAILTQKSNVKVSMLPAVIFVLGAVISFATGTSWGTMIVMFPIIIPLIISLSKDVDILAECIASVLSGAIFGDVSSPISGTTILTSMTCKVPIRDHFLTQIPYTALVAIICLLFGHIFVGLNIYPYYVGLLICISVCLAILLVFGSNIENNTKSVYKNVVELMLTKMLKSKNSIDNTHDIIHSSNTSDTPVE